MRYTMKYDFTTILDRKGKDAIALDALGVNNGRNHIQVERTWDLARNSGQLCWHLPNRIAAAVPCMIQSFFTLYSSAWSFIKRKNVNNSPRSAKGRLPDPAGLYIFWFYCLADESPGNAAGKSYRSRRRKNTQTCGIHRHGKKTGFTVLTMEKQKGFRAHLIARK